MSRFFDGLTNILANLGTSRDKASASRYVANSLTPNELLDMYRSSWVAAKIVDAPAEDATRKWRKWRAPVEQISKIEELENALKVQQVMQKAMTAARLWGGAAVYINTEERAQDAPLRIGAEIKSLVVLTRNELSASELVRDINSEYFGMPEYYTLSAKSGEPVKIHASRLVVLNGKELPTGANLQVGQSGWGDSVLQSAYDAVMQYGGTMANIASLVFEAKVDLFKFEGYAELLADSANDEQVTRRLINQAAMKSINGAVVLDTKDDYVSRTQSFGGLPEVTLKFMEQLAGAAKMPLTRIFGRAVAGLSGSGDGDERVYYDGINSLQTNIMTPAMKLLDECIIVQALGTRPADVYYEWRALRQLTEQDRADIFGKTANALRSLAGTAAGAVIPLDALSDAAVNELVELGLLPGLEAAIDKYGSLYEQEGLANEIP